MVRILGRFIGKLRCGIHCSYCTILPMKPPNILVNTACAERFTKQKQALGLHLPDDTYTVYHVDHEQLRKQSWIDACALLVCECDPSLKEDIAVVLDKFVSQHNGKLLLHGNSSNQLPLNFSDEVVVDLTKLQLNEPGRTDKLVLKKNLVDVSDNDLRLVLQNLGIKTGDLRYKELLYGPAQFYSTDEEVRLMDVLDFDSCNPSSILGDKLKITHVENYSFDEKPKEKDDEETLVLNVVSGATAQSDLPCPESRFDWNTYRSTLKTKQYGHQILYNDILPSTQELLTRLRSTAVKTDGFVVIAARQTKGRGRGGNAWLSPLGCMMFSIRLTIKIRSQLGQHLACIQHLIVVALVKAICDSPGYEDIALHIKWPNDIYAGGSIKIGGVIVNCSTCRDDFVAVVGFGVNVNNEKPTVCVNSLIREYNRTIDNHLKELSIEQVLAATLNHLEHLVDQFQTHGVEQFKEEYYKYWLHSGAKVVLEMMGNAEAAVVGIDDFGYLQVELGDKERVSLQPDGNTFDIMKNLISIKNR